VAAHAAHVTKNGRWLKLAGQLNWQFADVNYPTGSLYIRDVNKHMADFIVGHFEKVQVIALVQFQSFIL
jgi:hypothetical protein